MTWEALYDRRTRIGKVVNERSNKKISMKIPIYLQQISNFYTKFLDRTSSSQTLNKAHVYVPTKELNSLFLN